MKTLLTLTLTLILSASSTFAQDLGKTQSQLREKWGLPQSTGMEQSTGMLMEWHYYFDGDIVLVGYFQHGILKKVGFFAGHIDEEGRIYRNHMSANQIAMTVAKLTKTTKFQSDPDDPEFFFSECGKYIFSYDRHEMVGMVNLIGPEA